MELSSRPGHESGTKTLKIGSGELNIFQFADRARPADGGSGDVHPFAFTKWPATPAIHQVHFRIECGHLSQACQRNRLVLGINGAPKNRL